MWYWISLSYATFGIRSSTPSDGWVTDVPPIAHWAYGKNTDYVLRFYRRKGAIIKQLG